MRPAQAKVDAASCRVPPTRNAAGCRVYCLAIVAVLLMVAPGLAAAQDGLLGNMMRIQKDWLWFNIVDGRLSLRMTQMAQFETTSRSPRRQESFKLHNENGQPRLNYELTTDDELLRSPWPALATTSTSAACRRGRGRCWPWISGRRPASRWC